MSQPPPPPPPPPLLLTATSRPSSSDMTETQKPPVFAPPGFLDYPHRRLPPPVPLKSLEIPPDAVPPRLDHQYRSPINQLPSIHSGLPPRRDHYQPRPAAPVEKLLQHPVPYTPPRSDPSASPQQYGPPLSPHPEFDTRGPRRPTDPRFPYDDPRHVQHHQHHESPYSSHASPIEPSQQQQRPFIPGPSPGYASNYPSSSGPFPGSANARQPLQGDHNGAPPRPATYSDPLVNTAPTRAQPRGIPLPGSIPQPVYNEQL